MKVYVITKGAYSDYSIYGVAIDKEQAEMLRNYFSDEYDTANIEEYDTDFYQPIYVGKTFYHVCFYENSHNVFKWDYNIENDKIHKVIDYTKNSKIKLNYEIHVFAADEKQAFKIACDKLAEYKYRKAMKE